VEVDVIPHYPVGSVLFEIPSVVTPDGGRVADMDTEHIEKDDSDAVRESKENPRR